MLDHACRIEVMLEMHGPGEEPLALYPGDDVYQRSSNWARWQLGIPLPPE